jgi:hypothetical protein
MGVKNGDIRVRVIADPDPINWRKESDQISHMCCWHRRYDLGDEHDYKSPAEMLMAIVREADTPVEALRPIILAIITNDDYGRQDYRNEMEGLDREQRHDAWLDFIDAQVYEGSTDRINSAVHAVAQERAEILPLYLYDHSGITMSTGSFSCPWDSGQVGWIWMTHKAFIEETGYPTEEERETGVLGEESIAKCRGMLKNEVEAYDQYIRGDVYGYEIEKAEVCECCGTTSWEPLESCWGFYGTDEDNGMFDNVAEKYHELLRAALNDPEYL